MARQIDFAVDACKDLVKKLHVDGSDRTCIATFGSRFKIDQSYTRYESTALSSIEAIRSQNGGSTRLYDSIIDTISYISNNRRSGCAEVLLVLTDGYDNESRTYYKNPSACGNAIYRQFYSRPNSFIFVIGVGQGVNKTAMNQMSEAGRFAYLHVDDFQGLQTVLATLAVRIQEQTRAMIISDGSSALIAAQRSRTLGKIPIDYTLLIDVSSSMQDRAWDTRCPRNHQLTSRRWNSDWYCDVCGKSHSGVRSDHYCSHCDFDACEKHFKKEGGMPQAEAKCGSGHGLYMAGNGASTWVCNDCGRLKNGRRLRCTMCDYDLCSNCQSVDNLATIFALALLSGARR